MRSWFLLLVPRLNTLACVWFQHNVNGFFSEQCSSASSAGISHSNPRRDNFKAVSHFSLSFVPHTHLWRFVSTHLPVYSSASPLPNYHIEISRTFSSLPLFRFYIKMEYFCTCLGTQHARKMHARHVRWISNNTLRSICCNTVLTYIL